MPKIVTPKRKKINTVHPL